MSHERATNAATIYNHRSHLCNKGQYTYKLLLVLLRSSRRRRRNVVEDNNSQPFEFRVPKSRISCESAISTTHITGNLPISEQVEIIEVVIYNNIFIYLHCSIGAVRGLYSWPRLCNVCDKVTSMQNHFHFIIIGFFFYFHFQ